MDYNKLLRKSNLVIQLLQVKLSIVGDNQTLNSIVKQMEFISEHASKKQNPIDYLPVGRVFIFGLLASKELTDPGDDKLRETINTVSEILDES